MTHIDNQSAYEAGKQRRIRQNARIGRERRWYSVEGNKELADFLYEANDYAPIGCMVRYEDGFTKLYSIADVNAGLIEERYKDSREVYSYDYGMTMIHHPVVKAARGDFYIKMFHALEEFGALTEGQTKAVAQMLARSKAKVAEWQTAEQERLATALDCPEGRVEITGKVVSLKGKESRFGFTMKMVVESEQGFRVYGTAPDEVQKGQTITFTATVTPSETDAKFGFFKRPRIVKQKGAA